MLTVTAAAADPLSVDVDLLVVPVFKGGIEGPGTAAVIDALGLEAAPATPGFRGDIGQSLRLAAPGLRAAAVLLVGLGRMDASDDERLRRAAGVAAAQCGDVARVATTLPQVHAGAAALGAIAEGFHLGAPRDRPFRTGAPPSQLRDVVLLCPSSLLPEAPALLRRTELYARATLSARDLVNRPPGHKRPDALAAAIEQLAGAGCQVRVLQGDALASAGFGGILAVGRGSAVAPRLVELRYRPANPLGSVVLVGKGVTFDSGGLSLKRGTAMDTMKMDMAGAAAVAAVCSVLADLDVRLDVTGLVPLVENMPGADAQRPDDVITVHGGTTVEVRDTDAEGRLILADALDHAASFEPDAVVDLATLTGSSIGAVGGLAAALMSNDEDLGEALRRAAELAGEPLWPLPLWPDLERLLDSPIADLNNTGDGGGGGAIMGGLFLRRFVGEMPWAHLDIAGPAFLSPRLAAHYLPVGGTGYGVRTLLAWLQRRGG